MKVVGRIFVILAVIFIVTFCVGSACAQKLSSQAQALLDKARAANPERYRFAMEKGVQILPSSDGKSFFLVWQPKAATSLRPMIYALHGSNSWVFDEFSLWQPSLEKHGIGIIALQWWFGVNQSSQDYYPPSDIYRLFDHLAKEVNLQPGTVLLEGFSRGSANSYGVSFYDRTSGNNYFGFNFALSGSAELSYPLYADIEAGKYGEKVFAGTHWATFCGERDPKPEQTGCAGMQRTREWLTKHGATVDMVFEEAEMGHGGFNWKPELADRLFTHFKSLLPATPQTPWQVEPDSNFFIPGANIPNAGKVDGQIWLVVGGTQGLSLYRSSDGSNDTSRENIPGLQSALQGTGFIPSETIPREAADGANQLYVLGLAGPGVRRSVVYRLEERSGSFARFPSQPVFSGGPEDGGFLGVPDVYPVGDGKLRMIYVGMGAQRQNSRIAVSTDAGASFSFESNNPYNDLQLPSTAETTNVDPAVLKLSDGTYLSITMRATKLYLFQSTDGLVFTPIDQPAIEATIFQNGSGKGFFDPTLVELSDGSIAVYVTMESFNSPPGMPKDGGVVRFLLRKKPSLKLNVGSPNGGEVFRAGDQLTVNWSASDSSLISEQSVEISTDGGSSYTIALARGLTAETSSISAKLPSTAVSTAAKVKVTATGKDGSTASDESDGAFIIEPESTDEDHNPPTVKLLAPLGGEKLRAGTPLIVNWESTDDRAVTSHEVLLSADGGQTYASVSTALSGATKSFVYHIPDTHKRVKNARIKVVARDGAGNSGEDTSTDFLIKRSK